MKNQHHHFTLFRTLTGKTTISPKPVCKNPVGYWPARIKRIEKFGGI